VGEVVTRAGLRGHIFGFAPAGWAPKGGIIRDRVSYGVRAWSVEVETSGPRTPFRIVFEPDTEPR